MTTRAQVAILVIIVMLIQTIPNSVYAIDVVLPPQASDKTLPEMAAERIQILQIGNMRLEFRSLYVVADDPLNHEVPPGGTLDGVGDLIITIPGEGTFRCTGSLLLSGIHVLTAAHCVTDAAGNFVSGTTANITFEAVPDETIIVSSFSVHPDYRGDFLCGNDIAVLELVAPASASVDRYDIDRDGTDDVGSITNKVGYGRSGLGDDGDTIPSGTKREGMNLYDAFADTMLLSLSTPFTPLSDTKCDPAVNDFVPGSVLQYDFDNGDAANDAFGFFFAIPDLGLGDDEVKSAPGDSGGPSFDNPVITGVTSYGIRLSFTGGPPPRTSDVDRLFNDSFGEFAGDTRVSTYATFVDAIVDVPETLTLSLTPSSFSENSGTAASSGTVTRSGDTTSSLLVNLASSDTSEATVPASVTIPASQASVTFSINAVNDTLLDGTQTVTITASCLGCISDITSLDVTDFETLTVVIAAASIPENARRSTTATVTISNTDNASPLNVNLASSDTSEARVHTSVTIPTSQDSVTFSIKPVDDALLDGTQTVTITASADGYVSVPDSIDVLDNEIPPGVDDIGLYRPSTGEWFLSNDQGVTFTETGQFGFPTDIPITGDWNADVTDDIGLYRPSTGEWFLSTDQGVTFTEIGQFGFPTDIPVTGDWNADGTDDLGVYRPSNGHWFLADNQSPRRSIISSFTETGQFGFPTDIPITGDWNADGTDDIGLYRPSTGEWFLSTDQGVTFTEIGQFGFPTDIPITGDWNADGTDDIGLYRPSTGEWFPSTDQGVTFTEIGQFGFPTDIPVTGDWDGN